MMTIFLLWLLAAGFENCAFFCCRLVGRFDGFVLIGIGRNGSKGQLFWLNGMFALPVPSPKMRNTSSARRGHCPKSGNSGGSLPHFAQSGGRELSGTGRSERVRTGGRTEPMARARVTSVSGGNVSPWRQIFQFVVLCPAGRLGGFGGQSVSPEEPR